MYVSQCGSNSLASNKPQITAASGDLLNAHTHKTAQLRDSQIPNLWNYELINVQSCSKPLNFEVIYYIAIDN